MITIKVETNNGSKEYNVNSESLPLLERIDELLGSCKYIECRAYKVWSHVDYAPTCPRCDAAIHD